MKRINNKGFTLIELLGVIAIVAIILGIGTYGIVDLVTKSKEKGSLISETSIKESASLYADEAGDSLWIDPGSGNYKYYCITIEELINKGIIKKNAKLPKGIDKYNYVSTIDLRLLRRIVRDNRTRGYDVIKTIDNWQSVRNGEEKYIFPYIHQANVIINTALAYEVGVLKVYVEPLLLSVSVDSIYYEEARRLVDFLKQFFPIPGEYVNDESILREFIGGRYND